MGDRREFRIAAGESVACALAEAAQGRGEACFLACTERTDRAALLAAAMSKLPGPPRRFVLVRGSRPSPLGLDGFVAQALGRKGTEAPSADDQVAVFELLTGGRGVDRTLLVVDGAEQLTPQVIRYVQLACRSTPDLQVIFAGDPAFRDLLAQDEFAFLRRRLRPDIVVPYLSDEDVKLVIENIPALPGPVIRGGAPVPVVEDRVPDPIAAGDPARPLPIASSTRRHSRRAPAVALAAVAAMALVTLPAARPEVARAVTSLQQMVLPILKRASALTPEWMNPLREVALLAGPAEAARRL